MLSKNELRKLALYYRATDKQRDKEVQFSLIDLNFTPKEAWQLSVLSKKRNFGISLINAKQLLNNWQKLK